MKKLSRNSSGKTALRFPKGEIKAGVAGSFFRRMFGLSFRRRPIGNEGMLFVFPRAGQRVFWNFGMRFPIDIIWMNGGKIIGVQKNIPAMSEGIKLFMPSEKADSALEIPAGSADMIGAGVGDTINAIHER